MVSSTGVAVVVRGAAGGINHSEEGLEIGRESSHAAIASRLENPVS